jgi:hypothetical protein
VVEVGIGRGVSVLDEVDSRGDHGVGSRLAARGVGGDPRSGGVESD